MKKRWFVAIGTFAITLLVLIMSTFFMVEAMSRPFPGFFYEPNLLVCPVQEMESYGPKTGLVSGDSILGVEGKNIHSVEELKNRVGLLPVGTKLTYQIKREDRIIRISLPTQRMPWQVMVFHIIPCIFFGLLSILLGGWVLWNRPEDRTAWVHFFFSMALGILSPTNYEACWTQHFPPLFHASLILVGSTGLHLAMLFPRPWKVFRSDLRQALSYIPLSFLVLIPFFYSRREIWSLIFPFILIFSSLGIFSLVISAFFAWKSKTSSPLMRRQSVVILVGTFVSTLPTIVTYVLGLMGISVPFSGIISLLLLAFPLSIAFAILRYQLFDISLIIKRTVLYSFTVGILLIGYLAVVALGRFIFGNSDAISLLATLMAIVLYIPLQEWTKRTMDRLFYRKQYDPRLILAEFSDRIHSFADLDSASECFFEAFERALHPTWMALYRMEGEESVLFRSIGETEGPKELEISLSVKGERLGTLVLGPKKSDLPYHRMDVMLVKSLCQQFALWMKNAQLFLEVTRQQRLQLEALQQVDRMKDEFLSVVSHELRTPLNAVQGFGELLEREVLGPMNEEQQRAIGQILGGSDRILRLINDILDFTQIQSGAFGIFREPTDYLELVNEVVSLLAPLAEKKGIVIETDIAVESEILIDEQRIAQVLTNLVANSIKFMGEGKILIRAGFEGETLWTEVSDEGMGIPEDDLDRVFAPFTQLDMSSTRREGGTGLGLSITHGIVEAHGGSIVALSPGPGQGSTFRFVIPTNSIS